MATELTPIRWYHRLVPGLVARLTAANSLAAKDQREFADRYARALGPIETGAITAGKIQASRAP